MSSRRIDTGLATGGTVWWGVFFVIYLCVVLRDRVGAGHVGYEREVTSAVGAGQGDASTRFQDVSSVATPNLKVLRVNVGAR